MRIKGIVFIAALLLAAFVMSASAQFDDDENGRLGVRVGLFMPIDSELKDIDSSSWLGVGVDWSWKHDKEGAVKEYFSLVSYKTGETRRKAAEAHITYNRIFRKRAGGENSNYASIGVGVAKVSLEAWRPAEGGGIEFVDDNSWLPMGSLAVGREFRGMYYVELQFNAIQSWRGMNWSGLTLCLGARSAM